MGAQPGVKGASLFHSVDPQPIKGWRRQLGSAETLSARAVEDTLILLSKGEVIRAHARHIEYLAKET